MLIRLLLCPLSLTNLLLIALLPLLTALSAPAMASEGYGNPSKDAHGDTEQDASRQLAADSDQAPPEFDWTAPGVCRLYHLSGHMAIDSTGQVIGLRQYCRELQNWAWYEPSRFWRKFRRVATPEMLNFAQTLDRDSVEAYGQSICPFLQNGGTMQELTQLQANQQFPTGFEQAIIAASVRSYCPEYRSQLAD